MFLKKHVNYSMLFELRDGSKCILLHREKDNCNVFYSKRRILNNSDKNSGGVIKLEDYSDDLRDNTGGGSSIYDIMKIHQFESQSQVLWCVMNDKEPDEWDCFRRDYKEMTQEDIERELGYKIKIISRQ